MKILNERLVQEGVFCFGANEVGRSFSGAAKTAVEQYDAQLGISFGFTGQSFAIPTKDANLKPLNIKYIKNYIDEFLRLARDKGPLYPIQDKPYYKYMFMCTRIGCGLAGFTNEQIAPMFINATSNIEFDEEWKYWLGEIASDGEPRKYWGSYSDE
jgi:hypothetical protein